MPDGGDGAKTLSVGHLNTIARACTVMNEPAWARAAVAWLEVVAPRAVPEARADAEGVALHLLLFGFERKYWDRLCVLLDRWRLSDRWE